MSKFIRLWKFYPARTGLLNIKGKRLKVTTMDDINDPFEWMPFDIKKKNDRLRWNRFRKNYWKNRGIICFSEDWSHPLMWSHYADFHRGLALGFDVSKEVVEKVSYISKRTKIDDLSSYVKTFKDEEFKSHIYSKYDAWSYEKEWRTFIRLRILDRETGLYFKDFDSELQLKSVVIGDQSDVSSERIREASGLGGNLEIISARLSFKYFRVVKQNNKKLMK